MKKIYTIISFVLISQFVFAQQTVGLFLNDSTSFNGYTLFTPSFGFDTYLIDNCGFEVHKWEMASAPPVSAVYLLENGNLLRTGRIGSNFVAGGTGGRIELFSWEDELLWSYDYTSLDYHHHHDIAPMPNGNILLIAWERHLNDEVIENGRIPASTSGEVWSERIVEIKPLGTDSAEVVWQWSLWDHLIQDFDSTKLNYGVVTDHPELMDINAGLSTVGGDNKDWIHLNSIDYNSDLDQILLSSRHLSEIYIIDHSTTTAEAATHSGGNSGKGGDILFRWGNPQNYDRGDNDERKFYGQHDARWIPNGYPDEGKIMVFNNGLGRPGGSYSSVDIIEPSLVNNNTYTISNEAPFEPFELFWSYVAPNPSDIFSATISGAQRLPNGNTLICEGRAGTFYEVNYEGELVWNYQAPFNFSGVMTQGTPVNNNSNIFRATRYEPDYQAFMGKDLVPLALIELNPLPSTCEIFELPVSVNTISQLEKIEILNNPFNEFISIKNGTGAEVSIEVFDMMGKVYNNIETEDEFIEMDSNLLEDGTYVIRIFNKKRNQVYLEKIVKAN